MKDHNLFKAQNFEDGRNQVVGDCNGLTMDERYRLETPLFARAILGTTLPADVNGAVNILDYGCGVGRLAKELLKRNSQIKVYGVDASPEMLELAKQNCNSDRFIPVLPHEFLKLPKMDLAYCVYVLQHVPAVELRGIIERIHLSLHSNAPFVFCSSDYRMAIRFDGQGFCDDRFLGVDIRHEIERLFELKHNLFTVVDFANNPVLRTMVQGEGGGLAHPASVFIPRQIVDDYCTVFHDKLCEQPVESVEKLPVTDGKLILVNRLAPGDCLVMTAALRDLHKAYPGKYLTDVRTPCQEVYENNPYVTRFAYAESDYQTVLGEFHKLTQADLDPKSHVREISGGAKVIDMQYPLIHRSDATGAHFSEGHREFLEEILNLKIPRTDMRPEIFLSQTEKDWVSPVITKGGYDGRYWVINAGSKGDFTLKQYPFDWYQEIVTSLKDRITFVQIGAAGHNHSTLEGAVDMRGKTSLRELFRVIYHAEGVLTCVSLPYHVAAAFNKPAVCIAGAREGMRWECYATTQYLYANGCLPCGLQSCWKSSQEACKNKKDGIPLCFWLMTPADVIRAIDRYYIGGRIISEAVLV